MRYKKGAFSGSTPMYLKNKKTSMTTNAHTAMTLLRIRKLAQVFDSKRYKSVLTAKKVGIPKDMNRMNAQVGDAAQRTFEPNSPPSQIPAKRVLNRLIDNEVQNLLIVTSSFSIRIKDMLFI